MIWFLLVLYQVKHFVCDYPLQGKYMLGKFKGGYDWVLPLASHCSVHGLATLFIAMFIRPDIAAYLALFDFTVHFIMDRMKASPNLLGRYKGMSANEMRSAIETLNTSHLYDFHDQVKSQIRSNTYFWWALGLDQSVHHLTHYVIIAMLVM